MLPHYEFRFQLTTNYCESCLLEDANTIGIEFFRLHWLLAPQTICPRHLTFLRETCRCCNRHLQPRHWRSKTKFVLACAWTKKPLAQEPREHRDRPEQVRRCLASFEESLLAAIRGQTTDGTWFGGQSAPDILRVICDLLWLLTRAVGNDSYIQHCLEGSHFRPHCRWERPPKAKPWLGDLRIHDRRSVLATLALLLDSGVNRKILHDPRRLLMPGIRSKQNNLKDLKVGNSSADSLKTRCYQPRGARPTDKEGSPRHGTSVRTKLCVQEPSWRVVAVPKSWLPDEVRQRQKFRAPWRRHSPKGLPPLGCHCLRVQLVPSS